MFLLQAGLSLVIKGFFFFFFFDYVYDNPGLEAYLTDSAVPVCIYRVLLLRTPALPPPPPLSLCGGCHICIAGPFFLAGLPLHD